MGRPPGCGRGVGSAAKWFRGRYLAGRCRLAFLNAVKHSAPAREVGNKVLSALTRSVSRHSEMAATYWGAVLHCGARAGCGRGRQGWPVGGEPRRRSEASDTLVYALVSAFRLPRENAKNAEKRVWGMDGAAVAVNCVRRDIPDFGLETSGK